MNKMKLCLSMALMLSSSAFADELLEKAKKVNAYYKQGLVAMKKGESTKAKEAFQAALKLDPKHGHARYQMTLIPAAEERFKQAQRRAWFTKTKLPKVQMSDAPLAEVLEALNELASQATEKKFSPNFVVKDPGGVLADGKVSLQLNGVPLSVALKYALDQVGATAHYGQYVTEIRPAVK